MFMISQLGAGKTLLVHATLREAEAENQHYRNIPIYLSRYG